MRHLILSVTALLLAPLVLYAAEARPAANRPNVIVILADDLGYGDLGCYGATKIKTPNLDRLAEGGVRFTDAHTPSAVCTPTRYGLLTGRYAWRTWLKRGVLDGFDPPLIDAGRMTLASFLKGHGYDTLCVGKWHLGMTWTDKQGQPVAWRDQTPGFRPGDDVNYSKPTTGGPLDHGFDAYFGISASLDMSPYCFIDGRLPTLAPLPGTPHNKDMFRSQSAGVTAPGFTLEGVLPAVGKRTVEFIDSRRPGDKPFFIYMPLPSPHLPVVPNKEWQGKSEAGTYGDYVMETDAHIGAVLAALDRRGLTDNTLVLVTSDNGGLWHEWTPKEADDVKGYKPTPRGQYNAEHGHHSNGDLRGTKADIFEGGHRVPFIVRWPAKVKAGAVSGALVELNDTLATLAEILGDKLPDNAGEDSISFLPVLLDPSGDGGRTFSVHHSLQGVFGLREGPWKFVPSRGSGGFSAPRTVKSGAGEPTGQLYNIAEDRDETRNVWAEHPDVVERLEAKLKAIEEGTRTRP